ncbi:MAG: Mrp/NBP35 family ATP-binding protein [Planctomycetia bacterium]|uniref:Iron-sulfur cluster carrier protein n=2 Tax=Candidatus Brocadia sapporoensis TaxID=392547 RepID=A0A1V6M0W6_9BACT|nr:Mrp/NBP35 family ATP-binding protein [Candidatus Brocadia sp.]MDG6006512.1 ATP-binding protein [Candidatus Brocadia sp.]OQD46039.1 ATP-binding protein [Candidatus Brocadia sapporoensis]QOJ07992.1 MAG: Mrp/NBP35 family ATP-binding protein [Planctomycetia bacterium]TVL97560.1 MAG: ATP-binding protein [Candidatus Brocadia sp. BL1]
MSDCKIPFTCELCEKQLSCQLDQIEHNKWAIVQRMKDIKYKIVVMSNKGGVGKSTVTTNLGVTLARMGNKVGIADADIHGPNIPIMLGAEGRRLKSCSDGVLPLEVLPNLKVASLSFLIENPSMPVIWRDAAKWDFLCELMGSVCWGDLDYLLVDLPPGTGNEAISIIELIGKVDGSVIVTTPQEVVLLDVRKAVVFSRDSNVPIIGIVENMSGLICPHCNTRIDVFKTGGGEKICSELGVDFLGRIPLEPRITEKCDAGEAFVSACPDSDAAKAFEEIVKKCEIFVRTRRDELDKIAEFREVPFLGKIPVDPNFIEENPII